MASFEREILEALTKEELDPTRFEECACDLLRSVFPGLFPIRGGNDAGQDGGIPDGKGEPIPLICTTAVNVPRNLTKSLKSYKKAGGLRRQAVLLTSQELKGKKRSNLFGNAREEEFELIGLYDRHWVKARLLQNPDWCLKLLGFTGTPSALSTVPRSNRPSPEIERIGRDKDLEWLKSTVGDRLLVGQPGAGKTFLLRCLVRETPALFLVDPDRTAVANALREERPKIVIVDDAHRDPTTLEMLCHLREDRAEEEIPSFSILATCWPGEEEQIRARLRALPKGQVHRLELMTRREILKTLKQLLPDGSDELLGVLVDQAANKPGLAVTLAWLCLRGDWRQVIDGEALRFTLMPVLEELVGSEASDFLGVLSLGGQRGMPIDVVGSFLEVGRQKARELAIGLAAGGVLEEGRAGHLIVWPEDLRAALLRRTFFEGLARFPWRQLLDQVPDRDGAMREIVRSAHRGATVPVGELRELALKTQDEIVWRGMAALKEHGLWTLEHAPLDIVAFAAEALQTEPEETIPRLLEKAGEEPEPVNYLPVLPLRIIQGWLQEFLHDSRESLSRRRRAVGCARRFLDQGGDRSIALQAACLALSPEVHGTTSDPLRQGAITRWGVFPAVQLGEFKELWEDVRDLIVEIDSTQWPFLAELLWKWIRPVSEMPEESKATANAFVEQVLMDLIPLAGESPGLASELQRWGKRVDLDLRLDIDPVFTLLYPERRRALDDFKARDEQQRSSLNSIAQKWLKQRDPRAVAHDLVRYKREAAWLLRGRSFSPWPRELCLCLAEGAPRVEVWLEAFLEEQAPPELVEVFLGKILKSRPAGWKPLVERCFSSEALAGVATVAILTLPDPLEDLLALALDRASRYLSEISSSCLRREVPPATLLALLEVSDPDTAADFALAEWCAEPRECFREELRAACHDAILRTAEETDPDRRLQVGRVGDVLGGDPQLASDWLQKRMQVDGESAWVAESAEIQALAALEERQRMLLLERLRPGAAAYRMLSRLVDRNLKLYRRLLELEELEDYQLLPLQGIPDDAWAELALAALDRGHPATRLAERCFVGAPAFCGYGQEHWKEWDEAFANLAGHSNSRLSRVVCLGREEARRRIREADAKKHGDDLHGLGRLRH